MLDIQINFKGLVKVSIKFNSILYLHYKRAFKYILFDGKVTKIHCQYSEWIFFVACLEAYSLSPVNKCRCLGCMVLPIFFACDRYFNHIQSSVRLTAHLMERTMLPIKRRYVPHSTSTK